MIAGGLPVVCLDGDHVRKGLSSDLGFSRDDRKENIRRIAEMAKLLAEARIIAVVSVISPFEADRAHAGEIIGAGRLSMVHVDCPLDICVRRDVKALYKRALAGDVMQFTGISSPYEVPSQPEMTLRTDLLDEEQCTQALLALVHRHVRQPVDAPRGSAKPPLGWTADEGPV